jgi:hypothetical protein
MASKECFHFTNLKNLPSIKKHGLVPSLEGNSDAVQDENPKVSYSDTIIGAIGMYANFKQVYDEIKSGKRTPDLDSPKQVAAYNAVKKTSSIEEYLGDSVYLLFDGTGIDNTGGNHGNGGIYDASTKQTIPPEKLRVGLVRDDTTGHVSYSMFDYIHYLMAHISLKDYEQMIPSMQERFDIYYHEHKDEVDKFRNGNYSKKELPLDKFIEVTKHKIEEAKKVAEEKEDQEIK